MYSVSWGRGNGKAAEGEEHIGWLASAGGDGVIRIWEVTEEKGKVKARMMIENRSSHGVHDVNSVRFCGREGWETLLATAGDDGIVRVWEIAG